MPSSNTLSASFLLLVALVTGSEVPAMPVTCAHYADTGLPCLEIPRCGTGYSELEINKLSNGQGPSVSSSSLLFCFDDENLYVNVTAFGQKYQTNPGYTSCNDPIFNLDVHEAFIAPNMQPESGNNCYNELDLNPFNVAFNAGIYNPNLNSTAIVGNEFDCAGTGFEHETAATTDSWSASISFSFELLNCPYHCPLKQYCGHSTPNNVYRANFFRINELTEVSSCTSSTCEYMAWSPTMANPPAFHWPTKFGFLVLQL